ncbi:MAG: histidine kinase [Propionibacteriales bacterium]|nr:histidine kinase [Propionibacteriales bacterium]
MVPRLEDAPVSRLRTRGIGTAAVLMAAWIGASSQDAERPVLVVAVALVTLATFALLRRAPVVALVASLGAPLLSSWSGGAAGSDDPYLALIVVASYGIGRFARYRDQPYVAAGVLALMSFNVAAPGPFALPEQLIFPTLITVAPWVLGILVRRAREGELRAQDRASALEEVHRTDLEEATLRERLRVARELHDITAHTMNVVSLQAQVLRRRREDGQDIVIDDLRAIESGARQAMTELRQVLGALRPDGGSSLPGADRGIEDVPELVDQCRQAGQEIDVVVSGHPRSLPVGGSLAAYRVIQEALTNARRHGGPGTVRIEVSWLADRVRLLVRSPVAGGRSDREVSTGVGLVGMRERLHICGGQLDVGRLEPGTWVVRASVPIVGSS